MSDKFTAEHPAHPDYPRSHEAFNERLFFSQLNEPGYDEKMNMWKTLRENSYGKTLQSDEPKSNKENSESIRNPDSTHISTKTVFNSVKQNPHFNEISRLVNKPKPKLYLPRGGRKRTRVFKKKSNKRRTSKSSRRTSRKYK